MYIKSLEIENLRVFAKVKLGFQYPGKPVVKGAVPAFPNVNLILGNNGQGKTTVLRAIALSALSTILKDAGYTPYSMIRRKPGKESMKAGEKDEAVLTGTFVFHDQDVGSRSDVLNDNPYDTRVVIERKTHLERIRDDGSRTESDSVWEKMYDNDSPAFLVVGYSATRRVEEPQNYDAAARNRKALRYQRIAGLFQESFSMIPLERWLPDLKSRNRGRYTQVIHLIDKLLEKPFRFVGDFRREEYYFRQGASSVPLGALSDGYRAHVGWISDLLYHICKGCPSGKKLTETRGIVMVDEVDLHLHPSWQRTVVPALSKTFPALQFIVTTHSPIITGSLYSDNIWVMQEKRGRSVAVSLEGKIHGLNADQILVSHYFGLESSRSPSMQKKMHDVNLRALAGDKDASLEMLQYLSRGIESEREREESRSTPAEKSPLKREVGKAKKKSAKRRKKTAKAKKRSTKPRKKAAKKKKSAKRRRKAATAKMK